MTLFNVLPLLALVPVILVLLSTLGREDPNKASAWLLTALFCGLFTAWSAVTVLREGLFGFWPNHSEGFWGNQVWFDLLFGVTMAWVLIVPRAKAQGMKLPLWMLFVMCTASIGFSAMFARLLFLERAKK